MNGIIQEVEDFAAKVAPIIENAINPGTAAQTAAQAGAVVATVAGDALTVAELTKGLSAAIAFPWAALAQAWHDKASNISQDAVIVEDVAGILADLNIPGAADVVLLAKVASFLVPIVVNGFETGVIIGAAPYTAGPSPYRGR